MISPDDLIRNQSISHMIFDVIENALSDSPNAVTSNDSGEAEEKSSPGKKKAATITVMEATPKKNTGDRKSHFFGKENTEKHLDSQTALSNEPAELVEDNLIKVGILLVCV